MKKISVFALIFSSCAHSKVPAPPVPKVLPPIEAAQNSARCEAQKNFTLMVHGGVGYKASAAQSKVLLQILNDGHNLLEQGYRGIDVVQHVVEVMEDTGLFNAGKMGARTSIRTVELDASIMDGRNLAAGAVASVKDVRNPIRLARAVNQRTRHLLMVGPGASQLADELGMEKVTPDYFVGKLPAREEDSHHGTVGAVSFDRCGDLAAGTSTGGLTGKRPGRVGDSPIIGAGTYANNKTCAVSATGAGEKFIRASVGSRVSNILEYTKRDLNSAVQETLELVEKLEGDGGLIAINRKGEPHSATIKSDPMPSGFVREDGKVVLRDTTN